MSTVSIVPDEDIINLQVTSRQLAKIALLIECVEDNDKDLGPSELFDRITKHLKNVHGVLYDVEQVYYRNDDGQIRETSDNYVRISFAE